MQNKNPVRLMFFTAMAIFGTIGMFTRQLTIPTSVTALARGTIGALFLVLLRLGGRKKIDRTALRQDGA